MISEADAVYLFRTLAELQSDAMRLRTARWRRERDAYVDSIEDRCERIRDWVQKQDVLVEQRQLELP